MSGYKRLSPCGIVEWLPGGAVRGVKYFCPNYEGCGTITLCAKKLACDLVRVAAPLRDPIINQALVIGTICYDLDASPVFLKDEASVQIMRAEIIGALNQLEKAIREKKAL